MALSVIIPTHRRPYAADRLLMGLCEQEFPFKDLQVLVVSNLKDKILRQRAKFWRTKFFDFKYIETGIVGVNTARNTGIRFAGGGIVYFLDDDCLLPHPRHLARIIQAHKENPSLSAIGGPYRQKTDLSGAGKFYFEHSKKWLDEGGPQKGKLLGGNASYKREVFDKGFCFDPSIAFGGSEESLNQFLEKCGHKIGFDDSLYVFHNLKMGVFSLIKKSWRQGKGLLTNRLIEGQNAKSLRDMKSEWAFFPEGGSIYFLIYSLFFKLGYFWSLSLLTQKSFSVRGLRFLKLLLKSRLFFVSEHIFAKYAPWLWGRVILRFMGWMWYYAGWFWGRVILRFMGWIWYYAGWLWGCVILRFMGWMWYYAGWFWGRVILRFMGWIWYYAGWLWGCVILRFMGWMWYYAGWFWGRVILRFMGWIWYYAGWLWGRVILRFMGDIWYTHSRFLCWLYSKIFPRAKPLKPSRFYPFYEEKLKAFFVLPRGKKKPKSL